MAARTFLFFLVFISGTQLSRAKMKFFSYRELISLHTFIVQGEVILPESYKLNFIYFLKVERVMKGTITKDTICVYGREPGCTGMSAYPVEAGMKVVCFFTTSDMYGAYGSEYPAHVTPLHTPDEALYTPDFIYEYVNVLREPRKSLQNKKACKLLMKYADKPGLGYWIAVEMLEHPGDYRPYLTRFHKQRLAEMMVRQPDGDLLMLISFIGKQEWKRIRDIVLARLDPENYDRTEKLMFSIVEGGSRPGLLGIWSRYANDFNELTSVQRKELVDKFIQLAR